MKVDLAGTNSLYASQRLQDRMGDRLAVPFSAAMASAQADGSKQTDSVQQTDFSSMTRQEMRDWVNDQIRSGNMTLDDSTPFVTMTMKMPVGGFAEVDAATDGERIDFTQRARSGIEGARSRNDDVTAKLLESVLQIMQR